MTDGMQIYFMLLEGAFRDTIQQMLIKHTVLCTQKTNMNQDELSIWRRMET